jgi:hypothetical protein
MLPCRLFWSFPTQKVTFLFPKFVHWCHMCSVFSTNLSKIHYILTCKPHTPDTTLA